MENMMNGKAISLLRRMSKMELAEMRRFLKKMGKTDYEVFMLTVKSWNFYQIATAKPFNIQYNKIPF